MKSLLLIAVLFTSSLLFAQEKQSYENPYPKFVPYITEQITTEQNLVNVDIKDLGKEQPARWLSVDPLADKYPGWSPYNYVLNNPLIFVDPDGRYVDFYKDTEGNVQWFKDNRQTITVENKTWENIGTEYLEFSGRELTYFWQTTVDGEMILNQTNFTAVSGVGDWTSQSFTFDYSTSSQMNSNTGPIPEGLYSINKNAVQKWEDVGFGNKLLGVVGRGSWPGGYDSWGSHRWWINPEIANTYGRGGFTIHGGTSWGSRGCIDMRYGATSLYNSMSTNNLPNNKVYLGVRY